MTETCLASSSLSEGNSYFATHKDQFFFSEKYKNAICFEHAGHISLSFCLMGCRNSVSFQYLLYVTVIGCYKLSLHSPRAEVHVLWLLMLS
jgi:hypothetical protein